MAIFALFVPMVPAALASGQLLNVHVERTAVVSPSYYLFHCGSYIDSQLAGQIASGYSWFYQLPRGYTFACVYRSG